jgi:hypothetical protein
MTGTLKTKRILLAVVAFIGALGLLVFAMVADSIAYSPQPSATAPSTNHGTNGLWLRHLWYHGKYGTNDLEALMARLTAYQIRYAYFHVLRIGKDGRLHEHCLNQAQALNAAMHKSAPHTKSIAWVYVPSNEVALSDEQTRKVMTEEAKWLVNDCGFDGVQWDYEFAFDRDANLVKLLKETKAATPDHFVGAAAPMWYPGTLWGWSDDYIKSVAAASDQLAVMCYDSFFYHPRSYMWLVAQQCHHFIADARGTKCNIMLGVPSYDTGDGTLGHIAAAENLRYALLGVRNGMRGEQAERLEGVAIFADYTTSPPEWTDLESLWLTN